MTLSLYDRYLLPYLIDFACGIQSVSRQREKIVPLARGRVLEIGIGTGLNIPHYNRKKVKMIVGLDPGMHMHHLAQKRIKRSQLHVELVGLTAEKIPFDDGSFDSIVMTYSLCTIPEPLTALREMRRVLAPGGTLLFCEHGRAPDKLVRLWQTWLQPFWKKFTGGCHLDRDVPALLTQAGFTCRSLQSAYLQDPRPISYNYWGQAKIAPEVKGIPPKQR